MKIFHISFVSDWDVSNYVLVAETEADAMLNLWNWFLDNYDEETKNEKLWWKSLVDDHFRYSEVEVKEFGDVVSIHQSFD